MAYIYRHIRLDKNVPFYIGVGKDKSFNRAYSIRNRNKFWVNVVNKTTYEVEILFYDINYDFALEKEKEFIRLYGRHDMGLGTLVNLNDGGGGNSNWSDEAKLKHSLRRKELKISDEWRRKLSESHKGNKHSIETRIKMSVSRKGVIISPEIREKMASKLRGRPLSEKMKKMLIDLHTGRPATWSYHPITQFTRTGQFIKDYPSITHASNELKLQKSNIYKVLVGKRNHSGGFIFKYKN